MRFLSWTRWRRDAIEARPLAFLAHARRRQPDRRFDPELVVDEAATLSVARRPLPRGGPRWPQRAATGLGRPPLPHLIGLTHPTGMRASARCRESVQPRRGVRSPSTSTPGSSWMAPTARPVTDASATSARRGGEAPRLHRASPARGVLAPSPRALRARGRAAGGSEGTAPLPVRRPRNRRGAPRRRRRRYLHAGLTRGPSSGPALPLRRGDRRGARVRPRPARRRLGRALRPGPLCPPPTCRLAGRGLVAARPPALPDPSRGRARSRDPRWDGSPSTSSARLDTAPASRGSGTPRPSRAPIRTTGAPF
jgi:hypothetical protein